MVRTSYGEIERGDPFQSYACTTALASFSIFYLYLSISCGVPCYRKTKGYVMVISKCCLSITFQWHLNICAMQARHLGEAGKRNAGAHC